MWQHTCLSKNIAASHFAGKLNPIKHIKLPLSIVRHVSSEDLELQQQTSERSTVTLPAACSETIYKFGPWL